MECEVIDLPGGSCQYWPHWLESDEASRLHQCLLKTVEWQQDTINLFGRIVPLPRLQAWYGDAGARYCYSGISLEPVHWLPILQTVKIWVEEATCAKFNSVLINLYPTGQHSNGWHADDEASLGSDPLIASLSLGATRRFQLRHKNNKSLPVQSLNLMSGSLFFMGAGIQQAWQHQIPKTKKKVSPRISLTFRNVIDLSR
ncbi:MAG: alpha-ketoglutarate-dependent dioxygenase AlkB [Endozoicomonadaceae bacterium]|nr:alpha-ketoglutarate-dependent dioxygenase AlkB [Endozoicomonadaceae bacterium]